MTEYKFKFNHKPVQNGKIIGLGRTYKKHAQEMQSEIPKEPLLFLKPESAVIFNNGTIIIPKMSSNLHHEVELGVVIEKTCKNISQNNALDYVLGYLVGLDITARDIQTEAKKKGWSWAISKGFDTFAPISDVVLKKEIPDPNNLDIILKINGETRQHSNTKNMMFSVEWIIEYISEIMTLKRGDLILTGTPEGVGEIHESDILEAQLGTSCYLKVDVKK